MFKILTTPKEILCFLREALGDQLSVKASHKSHNGCTVSGRLPWTATLTVLGEGGKLKNCMLDQPVNTKGYSSIQFFLKGFVDS